MKSLETRNKIALAHLGKHVSPDTEFKAGHIFKEEWKQTISRKLYINGSDSYRKRALEAKGYQCEKCGIRDSTKLLVHHKREFNRKNRKLIKDITIHDLDNLMVLCKSCHCKEHNIQRNWGKFNGVIPQKQIELGLRVPNSNQKGGELVI